MYDFDFDFEMIPAATETDLNEFLKYDSIEDINNCLNCEKEKCNNCLRYRNGV